MKVKRKLLTALLALGVAGFSAAGSLALSVPARAADPSEGINVYGLTDLNGEKYTETAWKQGNGNWMGGNFKDEDKFDAAFKTHVLIDSPESSETKSVLSFGIFMNDTGAFYSDGGKNGYLLTFDQNYGLAISKNVTSGLLSTIGWSGTNALDVMFWDEDSKKAVLDLDGKGEEWTFDFYGEESYASALDYDLYGEIYSPDGFDLEFGTKEIEDGTKAYIYVKINEKLVLESNYTGEYNNENYTPLNNYADMKPAGTAVGVLSTERVVNVDDDGKLSYSYPNKNVRLADSDYWKETIASVKSYGIQDLMGTHVVDPQERMNTSFNYLASFDDEENFDGALKTHVVIDANGSSVLSLGIFMSKTENFYWDPATENNGYMLTFDEKYGIGIGRHTSSGFKGLIGWGGTNSLDVMFWDQAAKDAAWAAASPNEDADINHYGMESFAADLDWDLKSAIYDENGFDLEFGTVEVNGGDRAYIYVKINGQTVLNAFFHHNFDEGGQDYTNGQQPKGKASAVMSTGYSRLYDCDTWNEWQSAASEECTIVDLAELSGSIFKPHYSGKLGDLPSNQNAGVKMHVTMNLEKYDVYKVGIFMTNTGDWYNSTVESMGTMNGFFLTIDALDGYKDPALGLDRTMVPGMAIATDGNNGSNSDNPLARLSWATHSDLYAEIMSEDGFDLEFGAVNYGSEGERTHTLVYASVNGEVVLKGYYTEDLPTGKSVAVGGKGSSFHDAWGITSRTECDIRSTKEDVVFTTAADEDMTFVDWYEATGRAEIDFNTGDGVTNAYTPVGDLKKNNNVALRLYAYVDPNLQQAIQLYFFLGKPNNNHVWDEDKFDETTGYQIEIGVSGKLTGTPVDPANPDGDKYPQGKTMMYRLGDWSSDGPLYDVMTPREEPYLIEMGIRDAFLNGEKVGAYVYLKIDGEEVLGLLDDHVNPFNGTNVIGMRTKDPVGSVVFTTTRTRLNIVNDTEHVNLPAQSQVVLNEGATEYELLIPVEAGYVLTSVTWNGTVYGADKLTETVGGYKLTVPVDTTKPTMQGEFSATTEEKTVGLVLPSGDGATYEAVGATDGKIPYRGSVTVIITPAAGKKLVSVKVGETDMTDSLTLEGGKYTLVLDGVTADVELSAEFEDETYTVTANAASGGTIELSADTVSAGGSITVTVKPDEGYVLKSLTVNGQAVAVKADGTYVIENIFADQTVAAEFEKKQDTSVPTDSGSETDSASGTKAGCGSAISGVLGMGAIVLSVGACLLTLRVRKRK